MKRYKDDKNLLDKFSKSNSKRIKDFYFDSVDDEFKQKVLDYLNSRLSIIYSSKNCPDNSWNRKSKMTPEGLYDGGGVEIREAADGEIGFVFYFDCDAYHFEGWVYVAGDRAFFTDWKDDLNRKEEIAKYLMV